MTGKLGIVDVPESLRDALKAYKELEGARRAEDLVRKAGEAYVRVMRDAFSKDAEIQKALAETVEMPKRAAS